MAVIEQIVTDSFALYNGDAIQVLPSLPSQSVDLSIFSPPFADLYCYSDNPADLGNCRTYPEFFTHFGFLVNELRRLIKPGRLCVTHCTDLPIMKEREGYIGLRNFSGDIINLFEQKGFIFHSRHTIWKDPLIEATRTKSLGLLHKQLQKDSTMSRAGLPDYLLAFRIPGENAVPIIHPDGLTQYAGANNPTRGFSGIERSHQIWRAYASPVWLDIRQTLTLNVKIAREAQDEKHLCLATDSRVLTKEHGYIPIQEVRVGEKVLTHKGRWRAVQVVRNTGIQPVITIQAHGVPSLTITPDHKLWTRKSDWVRERDGAERVEPQWIEAQHTLRGYLNQRLPETEQPAINDIQTWWIVGRWLADGHWEARGAAILSCGEHKKADLLHNLGDRAGGVYFTRTAYQIRVLDRAGSLREILSRCGHGASGKHLPPEAFTLPLPQAEALLKGYLSGDGYKLEERQRWMMSSVSRDLLLGLSLLVQRVHGSIASIYAGRSEGETEIEGRTVHCQQEWVSSFDIGERRQQQFLLPDGAWKKVRSITDAGEAETWCLRVEEDESFTAEGCIVKNCPLQLDTIERALVLWSNPGEVVLDPFSGVGSTLHVAIQNGRRGIGVELKGSYYAQSVKNLRAAKSKQEQVTLFDQQEDEPETASSLME